MDAEEDLVNTNASILISLDTESGRYVVDFTCPEITENAIHYVAMILVMLSSADSDLFAEIYKSIKIWAGDDKERKEFIIKVVERLEKYIVSVQSQAKINAHNESLAIDSTRVFNVRGYYERN